jgi:hypothetical protein
VAAHTWPSLRTAHRSRCTRQPRPTRLPRARLLSSTRHSAVRFQSHHLAVLINLLERSASGAPIVNDPIDRAGTIGRSVIDSPPRTPRTTRARRKVGLRGAELTINCPLRRDSTAVAARINTSRSGSIREGSAGRQLVSDSAGAIHRTENGDRCQTPIPRSTDGTRPPQTSCTGLACCIDLPHDPGVAQLVEHRTVHPSGAGSSPAPGVQDTEGPRERAFVLGTSTSNRTVRDHRTARASLANTHAIEQHIPRGRSADMAELTPPTRDMIERALWPIRWVTPSWGASTCCSLWSKRMTISPRIGS